MTHREYKMTWRGERLTCAARTRGEARAIFKAMIGRMSGQRLRRKVRAA